MFSMIQNYIYEAEVLDLFSGSGALALESISRGAKKAIICDKSKKAIQIIKKNIQKTHFDNEIQIVNKDYKKALEELKNKKFDIIFLDPPYKTDFGKEAIKIILKNEMLEEDGIMIFETDKEDTYIESTKDIGIRKYGRVKLILLCRKESM